mgnify:CR=1 FL=1
MATITNPPANQALTPVAPGDRVFNFHQHAALWFSLGTGLLVMQIGAYLVPALGAQAALTVIVCGSVLGAGLLAWTAKIGCDSGLSSAGLMHATYGSSFARLPVLLNIVQLIGWTTFELVVMRDGTVAIARQSGSFSAAWWPLLATLLWGAVLLGLGSVFSGVMRASGTVLVSLALLAASVVTLPHALLVTLGMDAERWRRAESNPA